MKVRYYLDKAINESTDSEQARLRKDSGTNDMVTLSDELVTKPIEELESVLYDLWATCCYERTDFCSSMKVRLDQCRNSILAEYDLRLMYALETPEAIPTEGKQEIVVADVKGVLHFSIFDREGKRIVETDASKLAHQAGPIKALRDQLVVWQPRHDLSPSEKQQVITGVLSIVGHTYYIRFRQLLTETPEKLDFAQLKTEFDSFANDPAFSQRADPSPQHADPFDCLLEVSRCGVQTGKKGVLDLLASIKLHVQKEIDQHENQKLQRQKILVLDLLADAQLRNNRLENADAQLRNHRLEEASKTIEEGLISIRPGLAGQDYYRYRSAFLMARAKRHWLEKSDSGFVYAYRDLGLARGCADHLGDHIFLARIDLHSAECALEHAQWHFSSMKDEDTAQQTEEKLQRTEAKLQVVRSYLHQAFENLSNGRRNVLWWKEYAQLYAKYQMCRNQIRLTQAQQMTEDDKPRVVALARGFRRTLRQGLFHIKGGLDVELHPLHNESWQIKIYKGMMRDGMEFGMIVARLLSSEYRKQSGNQQLTSDTIVAPLLSREYRERSGTQQLPTDLFRYWEWLMESLGIRGDSLNLTEDGNEKAFVPDTWEDRDWTCPQTIEKFVKSVRAYT